MELKFSNCFGDKRLENRAVKMVQDLFSKCVHSIRQLAGDYASQRGWYRFLHNKKTTEKELIEQYGKCCNIAAHGRVVLSIQDTSDINLYNHKNRVKVDGSLGQTNSPNYGLGFLIHPSFVVDAVSGFPLGFSDIQLWNRPTEKVTKHDRQYNKLPLKEKESYKWIAASKATQATLSAADTVIIVQDREGDIYEQFATIPDEKTHLLIRSKTNPAVIAGAEGVKLSAKLDGCKQVGTYKVVIPGDKRKKQTKRTATLSIRFCKIQITRPRSADKNLKSQVDLYAVEAKEIVTAKNKGIHWKILTTVPVTTVQEARCVLEWYSWRWLIEEVFRILKKEGYNIEASELESGVAIKKLCLLMMASIVRLFQMRYCYSIPEAETLESQMCFSQQEIDCLEQQCEGLEGKTAKLKNPYPKGSLPHATWVIARLGGWKGYRSEKIGITTLWIGLRRFYDIFYGWRLYEDVYTR